MSTLSQRASDTAKMADADEGGGLALATARTTKPPPTHRLPAIPEVPKAGSGGGREQLRHCFVPADENGCLGLHLSRTPWDPYPWVSGVVDGSGADLAGVRTGDCVLEANGEDLLGLKVIDIARRVRSRRSSRSAPAGVGLLLWNSGFEKNNLNPQSLSRFANCLQGIAGLLECPICLEVIRPPSWQCNHGHLICSGCRSRTTKCPICREVLGRGRCIVADKLFHYLVQTLGHEADQQTALDPKSQDTTHTQQHQQQQQQHPHHWSANNSGRLPLVRREYYQHRPTQHTIPTHAFKLKANNAPDGGVPATASLLAGSRVTTPHRTPTTTTTTTTTRTALYHCPSGQPCARMKNQHDILMHLQKAHQTSVVQYYVTVDDTVDVTVADAGHCSALACVVVVPPSPSAARGNQLFFVARFRCPEEPNETLCWLWHLGAEPATGQFRVQLSPVAGDEPTKPWQGRPVSLEWSRQEILKSKRFVRTKLASLPQRMRVRVLLDAAGEAVDA
uniref:RING-type domain-containing protein n=1 Tax=Anopheles arabiensis TaxID=7173 RepID=A0A182HTF2_ANOAR